MLTQVHTIARFTLTEAFRNRLLWLALVIVIGGLGLSWLLRAAAITESREIQAAFLAALLRLCAVFFLCAFIITSMVREHSDKVLELLFTFPLPRAAYFSGKWLGYAAVAALLAGLFTLPLLFIASISQVILWGGSLLCELSIVAAFSLFAVITLAQVVPALSAALGFYVLARTISAIQLIGTGPLTEPDLLQTVVNILLSAIAALLPRLDSFTQTAWLVYGQGTWNDLLLIAVQSGIYLILLSGAALFDLYRRSL